MGSNTYESLPVSQFDRDQARRSLGYDQFVVAVGNLVAVAGEAVRLMSTGDYALQVELTRSPTEMPAVPDLKLDEFRRGQASLQHALLNGQVV